MVDKLKSKRLRSLLVVIILSVTIALFARYMILNPEVYDTMRSLDFYTLGLLSLAYTGTILANAVILFYSLRYIGYSVPLKDNFLLTGYSAIVNFFGPLQSGPGFRAIYLKKAHNVKLKSFLLVTIIFYMFFGLINSGILFMGAIFESNILAPLSILALVLIITITYRYSPKLRYYLQSLSHANLSNKNFWLIGVGAILLTASAYVVFATELYHVNPDVRAHQILIYTAAANLSLFVSLTPGAIGFRESFLVLSQNLHNIPLDTIAAASIIDRAFYIIFLGVLFVFLLAWGNKRFWKQA